MDITIEGNELATNICQWAGEVRWKENGMRTDADLDYVVRGITEGSKATLGEVLHCDDPAKITRPTVHAATKAIAYLFCDAIRIEFMEYKIRKGKDGDHSLSVHAAVHLAE